MSSSDAITNMLALPWALDEFASNDIFPASGPSTSAADVRPDPAPGETLYSERERSRVEAEAYARGVADGERILRSDSNLVAERKLKNEIVQRPSQHMNDLANKEPNLHGHLWHVLHNGGNRPFFRLVLTEQGLHGISTVMLREFEFQLLKVFLRTVNPRPDTRQ